MTGVGVGAEQRTWGEWVNQVMSDWTGFGTGRSGNAAHGISPQVESGLKNLFHEASGKIDLQDIKVRDIDGRVVISLPDNSNWVTTVVRVHKALESVRLIADSAAVYKKDSPDLQLELSRSVCVHKRASEGCVTFEALFLSGNPAEEVIQRLEKARNGATRHDTSDQISENISGKVPSGRHLKYAILEQLAAFNQGVRGTNTAQDEQSVRSHIKHALKDVLAESSPIEFKPGYKTDSGPDNLNTLEISVPVTSANFREISAALQKADIKQDDGLFSLSPGKLHVLLTGSWTLLAARFRGELADL